MADRSLTKFMQWYSSFLILILSLGLSLFILLPVTGVMHEADNALLNPEHLVVLCPGLDFS